MQKIKQGFAKTPGTPRLPSEGAKMGKTFHSPEDIAAYFEREPRRLVDYIDTGLQRRVAVFGPHIVQLGRRVNVLPKFGQLVINALPQGLWVRPDKFSNIGFIIEMGRIMFPQRVALI